jgi:hypothetical protein
VGSRVVWIEPRRRRGTWQLGFPIRLTAELCLGLRRYRGGRWRGRTVLCSRPRVARVSNRGGRAQGRNRWSLVRQRVPWSTTAWTGCHLSLPELGAGMDQVTRSRRMVPAVPRGNRRIRRPTGGPSAHPRSYRVFVPRPLSSYRRKLPRIHVAVRACFAIRVLEHRIDADYDGPAGHSRRTPEAGHSKRAGTVPLFAALVGRLRSSDQRQSLGHRRKRESGDRSPVLARAARVDHLGASWSHCFSRPPRHSRCIRG